MQAKNESEQPPRKLDDEGQDAITARYRSWDLAITFRDLSSEMAKHVDGKSVPTLEEVRRWHEWIYHAAPVYWALESACEDLVEDGSSDERVAAIKQALTQAQGLTTYWARKDRW